MTPNPTCDHVPEARVVASIGEVSAERWDGCIANAIEDHAALVAIENARLAGFELRYLLVESTGKLLAAAPAFIAHYPLDTMMDGLPARIVHHLRLLFGGAFNPRLACIGSPCTEAAGIGFAPDTSFAQRALLAEQLLGALAKIASENDCALLAIKDMPIGDVTPFSRALQEMGFHTAPGQPNAWLPITFTDIDGYFGTLSRATRRDLRRKLRARGDVRVEYRTDIQDISEQVFVLYLQTRARASHRFETLTASYFSEVLDRMPGRAFLALYYIEGVLSAANLLIEEGGTLLDKYWCMADAAREQNLYYLSWITNIQHCIANNLHCYRAGQASPQLKRRLGCRFDLSTTFVRHRNALLNRALGVALPLLGGDQSHMDLA